MSGPALWIAWGALIVASAQLAVTTGRTTVAVSAAAIALGALVRSRRFRIGSAGEVLVVLALGVGGVILHGLDPAAVGRGSAPLRSAMFVFAFVGLFAAAVRLHLDRPEGGAPATLAAAGIVFLACGTVRTGVWLPRLFGLYLLLALVALATDAWRRGSTLAPWQARGRHLWVSLLLLTAIPLAMLAWASAGPRLVRSGTSYLLDRLGPSHGTGFHDGPITLHALDGLLDSDEVVLRIDGASPPMLRGNVYVHYMRGRWQPPSVETDAPPLMLVGDPSAPGSQMRIEYAGGDSDRFFLPLGAEPHGLEPEAASVDPWRIVRARDGAPEVAELSWPPRGDVSLAEPSAEDLALPVGLSEPLLAASLRIAPDVGAPLADAARRLAAGLASQLSYSLDFRDAFTRAQRARPLVDPVVIFIEDVREGHCEYFASALALMLRARGIPARFVTGYRVGERNPIGDYAVVRERHAHAWVEAYLPGEGWVSLDGTPLGGPIGVGLDQTPRVAALFDFLAREARRHGQRVLLVVLVVGLAFVQVVRLWRGRRGTHAGSAPTARRTARALKQLLARLAESGFDRAPSESLESLARRLRGVSFEAAAASSGRRAPSTESAAEIPPALFEAADLLDRYAAHRYGDVGDWDGLERDLSGWPAPLDEAGMRSDR